MKNRTILMLACAGTLANVLLAGCAANKSANYAKAVADVRTAYTITETIVNAEIAAGAIPSAQAAIIQTAESKADPVVAALTATSATPTVAAVLADAQALIGELPKGATATDAQQALLAATVAWDAYTGLDGAKIK